jgi:hypothetical protein
LPASRQVQAGHERIGRSGFSAMVCALARSVVIALTSWSAMWPDLRRRRSGGNCAGVVEQAERSEHNLNPSRTTARLCRVRQLSIT